MPLLLETKNLHKNWFGRLQAVVTLMICLEHSFLQALLMLLIIAILLNNLIYIFHKEGACMICCQLPDGPTQKKKKACMEGNEVGTFDFQQSLNRYHRELISELLVCPFYFSTHTLLLLWSKKINSLTWRTLLCSPISSCL